MKFNPNKHDRRSLRLKGYDYSQYGDYFVTVCTKNKECFFGNIRNHKMHLSEIGKIAHKYWKEIHEHFPHVKLDEFIVMPNHIHGIVTITENIVGAQNFAPLHAPTAHYKNKFGPQSKNLSSIVRGFKMAVTKYAKMNDISFAWQRSFYDHIIRDEKSFNNIQEYIRNNHLCWKEDLENTGYLPQISDAEREKRADRYYKNLSC